MPLYRATIHKHWVGVSFDASWSNVYTLLTNNVTEAKGVMDAIQLNEKSVSYNVVRFDGGRVVNVANNADQAKSSYDTLGELSPTGLGGPLPLFCCVRVTFLNATGKPEQKYLRLGANEANLGDGVWSGEFLTFIDTNYAQQLLLQLPYVGPSGEDHTGVDVHVEVQNRQLGWHRRTRPGFHRGWVPV